MCECSSRYPAHHATAIVVAGQRAVIAYLEKVQTQKAADGDPCTPIADLCPPDASAAAKACCNDARIDYLVCLINCNDTPACCAACESTYRARVEGCLAPLS